MKHTITQDAFDLLALSLVPGLGTRRTHALLSRLGFPSEILKLSQRQLRGLGLPTESQYAISTGQCRREAEEAVARIRRAGGWILGYFDSDYPPRLKQIFDPPLTLYGIGSKTDLLQHCVSIVGTRKPSCYGTQIATRMARELAELGLIIVSGMARGIDSRAHRGALEARGRTIAVLGTGADVPYPRENRKLYRQIIENGCVISEFPPGTHPAPQNFPIRNRIISGLSFGVLIPEAAEFSGSLITARLSLEQDRDVWAVPGNITNPGSYGPNFLIRQGAKPILSVQDVLEELPLETLNQMRADAPGAPERNPLEPEEMAVLQAIAESDSVHFDQLLCQTDQTAGRLNYVLMNLEMKGAVEVLPGRRYVRRL